MVRKTARILEDEQQRFCFERRQILQLQEAALLDPRWRTFKKQHSVFQSSRDLLPVVEVANQFSNAQSFKFPRSDIDNVSQMLAESQLFWENS